VCKRLRSSQHTSHIPVIMLTARAASQEKVRGLEVGANDYLAKPFVRQELLARVRSVLSWSRTQRDANPLTGLPGNVTIEAITSDRLTAGRPFAFLYVDIDQFKAYNDSYGYRRGDDIIRLTAEILVAVVEACGSPRDFVGHIGGDDFVLVTEAETGLPVAEEIVRRFEAVVPDQYNEDDRKKRYVEVTSRQGRMERAPLMGLTLVVVSTETRSFTHYAGLIDVVAQLKRYGKSRPGSLVVYDRRGDGIVESEPAARCKEEN
jgi:diguanylate cyclase (GGDEF)-like protein